MKTIYRAEYRIMCALLREYRERAGLTQIELSDLLSASLQLHASQIGKIERGERRLDIFELMAFCTAIGISIHDFLNDLERRIAA